MAACPRIRTEDAPMIQKMVAKGAANQRSGILHARKPLEWLCTCEDKTLPNNKQTSIKVLLPVVRRQYVEASQGWLLLTSLFDLQLVRVLELQESLIQP